MSRGRNVFFLTFHVCIETAKFVVVKQSVSVGIMEFKDPTEHHEFFGCVSRSVVHASKDFRKAELVVSVRVRHKEDCIRIKISPFAELAVGRCGVASHQIGLIPFFVFECSFG